MVRIFSAALDVGLMAMLVTFVVDVQVRRFVSKRQVLAVAAFAWALLVAAILLENDSVYLGVILAYIVALVFMHAQTRRLKAIVRTLFLILIAGIPLVTVVLVLNVLGIDVIFGYGDALDALASLFSFLVIFWVWRQRRRFHDELAVHLSVPECFMAVYLFLLTTLLGLVLNPETGELAPEVLASASGGFLVAMVVALVVSSNVFFLIMVWRSKTTAYYRTMTALGEQLVVTELTYFESYRQSQEDIRAFRHDMKHHLAQMQMLAEKGDTEALAAYLQSYQENWEKSATGLYQTGNDYVDALLNGRAAEIRRAEIDVRIEGAFHAPLRLSAYDTCAIFANAIDNAIEANKRLADADARWLALKIRQNAQFVVVTLANPVGERLAPGARTSKRDARNHGFGLYSIREKAEKNGGSIEITQKPGRYELNIFLPR